ncbi:MAG: DUF2092 domain-containing protein [Desulfobacteraceae bacterium]|nr:MAG: DUF2092 domain-containing protein [Desulfobacteraceae bacterium]
MKLFKLFCLIVILFCSTPNLFGAEQIHQIQAQNILDKVNSSYLKLKSYQDSGILSTAYNTINFETYFVRPNLFLFKWVEQRDELSPKTLRKEKVSRYFAIWSDGLNFNEHYYYNDDSNEGVIKVKSLNNLIAGATGISLGAASKVSSLLILDISSRPTTLLGNPILLGTQIVQGKECYHIGGTRADGDWDIEIWISKNDYLIRKYKRTSEKITAETIYKTVKSDHSIPNSIFNFDQKGTGITN